MSLTLHDNRTWPKDPTENRVLTLRADSWYHSFMNQEQLKQIAAWAAKRGYAQYTARPGNGCIWVSAGRIELYFIFNSANQIVDIQVD
jgi:hypothetical protein